MPQSTNANICLSVTIVSIDIVAVKGFLNLITKNNSKMIIAASLEKPKTWFIFRPLGIEVQVVVKNNMLRPNHQLTSEEIQFFKSHILEVGEIIINVA